MRWRLFLIAAAVAVAQTPPDVVDLFRTAAEALTQNDASGFLSKFDRNMPEYDKLRDEVEKLVTSMHVGSTIEIVNDGGDGQKRALELDWVLEVEDQQPRRQILKCRIERRGRNWRIVALEPVAFFSSS
jgi:hypothetical protein